MGFGGSQLTKRRRRTNFSTFFFFFSATNSDAPTYVDNPKTATLMENKSKNAAKTSYPRLKPNKPCTN
jgi:hypothetical protein